MLSSPTKPDIKLLRAKLIHECQDFCPREIVFIARKAHPNISQTIWTLGSNEFHNGAFNPVGVKQEMKAQRHVSAGTCRDPIDLTDDASDDDQYPAGYQVMDPMTNTYIQTYSLQQFQPVKPQRDPMKKQQLFQHTSSTNDPRYRPFYPRWAPRPQSTSRIPEPIIRYQALPMKERFIVMDGETWKFKKVGTRHEATAMSNNPAIDVGNNVWLFRTYLLQRSHFLSYQISTHADITSE